MLWLVTRERLEQMSRDPEFLHTYDSAVDGLDAAYAAKNTWMARRFPDLQNTTIAYFSAEFAHPSVAADLRRRPRRARRRSLQGVERPRRAARRRRLHVSAGLFPSDGLTRRLAARNLRAAELAGRRHRAGAASPTASPCIVAVPLGDRAVLTQRLESRRSAGSTCTCSIPGSRRTRPQDRDLSARLYGGDRETRLQQEIILGIGGVRALRALGIAPAVWHLNEGHAAFVGAAADLRVHRRRA